jgi:hypothetical protein
VWSVRDREAQGDRNQVGITERRKGGETVYATTDLFNYPGILQPVEHITTDPRFKGFLHAELAAMQAKDLLRCYFNVLLQTKCIHLLINDNIMSWFCMGSIFLEDLKEHIVLPDHRMIVTRRVLNLIK